MLQVLIEVNDKYSLSEMVQMAIEGGCGWIVLGEGIDEAEQRENYPAIVELCRESGIMLTATADAAAAKEYGLHGVFLPLGAGAPVKVREELGPEAVIGAAVGESSVALELEKADIDYVAVAPNEKAATLIGEIRDAGSQLPVVAYVDSADTDYVSTVLAMGFSGICCGKPLFETGDPVETIASLRSFLLKR